MIPVIRPDVGNTLEELQALLQLLIVWKGMVLQNLMVLHLYIKRGRRRPCKTSQPPSYDDYPGNASAEDITKWKCRKNTEKWCYEKLMSNEAADFREKEKERVTKYVSEKRQELIDASLGKSSVYTHVEEDLTPNPKQKKKVVKGKMIRKMLYM